MEGRGWRNKYRKGMPASERWLKDVRHALADALCFVRNGFRLPVIVVYPDFPSSRTTISKIGRFLSYRVTNIPVRRAGIVLYFEDHTHGTSAPLTTRYPGVQVINAACTDISKSRTDEVHGEVLGYSTRINPLTHQGSAVEKSEANARHDGRIIQCPADQVKPGCVYQLVIDNSHDPGHVVDFRVPVIGDCIPLCYRKFKRTADRFTNEVSHSTLEKPEDWFSAEEMRQMVDFAQAMGAQFCELDVLRHKGDGRMYIVDLNKTPYGPPAGLDRASVAKAVRLLAEAFRDAFIGRLQTSR